MNAHGTASMRRTGCKCAECVAYSTRLKKLWRHKTKAARGDVPLYPTTVDGMAVQAHIRRLLASGWTLAALAAETGRSQQAMWNLVYRTRNGGGVKRYRVETASELLAILPLAADPGSVDHVVVDRLLEGTAEWTDATLAERIEAGRRVIRREGGAVFCERVLHLRHDVIRELRQGERVAS